MPDPILSGFDSFFRDSEVACLERFVHGNYDVLAGAVRRLSMTLQRSIPANALILDVLDLRILLFVAKLLQMGVLGQLVRQQ